MKYRKAPGFSTPWMLLDSVRMIEIHKGFILLSWHGVSAFQDFIWVEYEVPVGHRNFQHPGSYWMILK